VNESVSLIPKSRLNIPLEDICFNTKISLKEIPLKVDRLYNVTELLASSLYKPLDNKRDSFKREKVSKRELFYAF
jgi:hypothetical protein